MQFTGSYSSLVRTVHWFMQFTGSYSSLVRAVHWFVQFTGSLVRTVHWFTGSCSCVHWFVQFTGSLVRVVHWFMQFTGSYSSLVRAAHWFMQFIGSLVHAVHWFTGSCSSLVHWFTGSCSMHSLCIIINKYNNFVQQCVCIMHYLLLIFSWVMHVASNTCRFFSYSSSIFEISSVVLGPSGIESSCI